MKEKVIGD